MRDGNYVIYNGFEKLEIGYMKICTCEKCRERGVAEIFITSLDGDHIDCVKANDTKNILYISNSLDETIETMRDMYEARIMKIKTQLNVQETLLNQLSLIS